MKMSKLLMLGTAAWLGAASAGSALTLQYVANLQDINNLGASGQVHLTLDDVTNQLTVNVKASGLDPDMTHVQHIHGVKNPDGSNGNSQTPGAAQDTDNDGFIELGEGAVTYGPIIMSLTSDPSAGLAGFPTAPGGEIDFTQTYDLLTTEAYNGTFDINDLLDLEDREIVIHGAFTPFEPVDEIPGLGGGIADDGNGNPLLATNGPIYNAALPVLAGEINPVPVPAAGWLLIAGLGGLGALRRFRKA